MYPSPLSDHCNKKLIKYLGEDNSSILPNFPSFLPTDDDGRCVECSVVVTHRCNQIVRLQSLLTSLLITKWGEKKVCSKSLLCLIRRGKPGGPGVCLSAVILWRSYTGAPLMRLQSGMVTCVVRPLLVFTGLRLDSWQTSRLTQCGCFFKGSFEVQYTHKLDVQKHTLEKEEKPSTFDSSFYPIYWVLHSRLIFFPRLFIGYKDDVSFPKGSRVLCLMPGRRCRFEAVVGWGGGGHVGGSARKKQPV